jgi:acyl carrier protein
MEYSDWKAAVAPKVQGSWNLHETLPNDMDFFLMLSSLNGIFGNRSQANYAAGNTYQDGLAKYRNSIGLPASTVDLGTILSVGFVAENKDYAKQTNFPSEALREDEVHSIIEYLIDPRHTFEGTHQLTFGFSSDIVRRERALQSLAFLRYPMYNHMHSHENVQGVEAKADDAVYPASTLLTAARNLDEAVTVVTTGIRHKIATMLSIAVDVIDAAHSISSYGIDSLSAIEVRTWLVKDLGADIPFLQLVGTASIKTISEKVVGLSKLVYFDKTVV